MLLYKKTVSTRIFDDKLHPQILSVVPTANTPLNFQWMPCITLNFYEQILYCMLQVIHDRIHFYLLTTILSSDFGNPLIASVDSDHLYLPHMWRLSRCSPLEDPSSKWWHGTTCNTKHNYTDLILRGQQKSGNRQSEVLNIL